MDDIQVAVGVIFGIVVVGALAISLYVNVFEKEDEKGNTSGGGFWKFLLCIVIVIIVFCLIGMCGDGSPWSPRHT
jgi:hypothetical protein